MPLPATSRPTATRPCLRSGQHWSVPRVQTLRRQLGLGNTRRRGSSRAALGPDEWWAREVAGKLDLSPSSLLYWIERGVVRARKENGGGGRRGGGGRAGGLGGVGPASRR